MCMGCIAPARERRVGKEGEEEAPVSDEEENNKALVRRYFAEAWSKGNVAAVDEFMAPNYVEYPTTSGVLPPGPEGLKEAITTITRPSPTSRPPSMISSPKVRWWRTAGSCAAPTWASG
jgi:hypothetical protein